MDLQFLLILGIILLCAFYLTRRFLRQVKASKGGCGCDQTTCSSKPDSAHKSMEV